jgi:hypothetical protein
MGCPKLCRGGSPGAAKRPKLALLRTREPPWPPGGLDIEGAFPYAGTAMAVVCPDYVWSFWTQDE